MAQKDNMLATMSALLSLTLLLQTAPVTLDAQHEPLRARFDADASHPRLLLILSPT